MVIDGEEIPNVSIYYFDSENYVPIMVHEEVMDGPGKGMIMESKMSDYQEVEGLYMPFSMTQGVKDQPGQPITISSIELNPTVDESEFEFPESTEEETANPAWLDARIAAYGTLASQIEFITEKGLAAWQEEVAAIKLANPIV